MGMGKSIPLLLRAGNDLIPSSLAVTAARKKNIQSRALQKAEIMMASSHLSKSRAEFIK
jgi:hypothetical protein